MHVVDSFSGVFWDLVLWEVHCLVRVPIGIMDITWMMEHSSFLRLFYAT